MYCSLSGVVPKDPVVSIKSGQLYERSVIEKFIESKGHEPGTAQEISKNDLLAVKSNDAIRPRPAGATSIPGLLHIMQGEWDALMLETYSLKQQLNATREELAKALYKHDAACRVIARLMQERDAARTALTQAQAAPARDGNQMDVDEQAAASALPAAVLKNLDTTAGNLSSNRKKHVKALASQVTDAATLQKYSVVASHPLHTTSKPGITSLDIHSTNTNLIVTGGTDGHAIVFDYESKKALHTLKPHKKRVTSVSWHPSKEIVVTSSEDATATVWTKTDDYNQTAVLADQESEVVGASIHPSGDYVFTAEAAGKWHIYDLTTGTKYASVNAGAEGKYSFSAVQVHPDGLIMGCGTEDGYIRIFDIKQQSNAASFNEGHKGRINSVSFSENGYYLASADASGVVKVWDLRTLAAVHTIEADDVNNNAHSVSFDASGTYLAVGGGDVRIFSVKPFQQVVSFKEHKSEVTGVRIAKNAAYIASGSRDRHLKLYSVA